MLLADALVVDDWAVPFDALVSIKALSQCGPGRVLHIETRGTAQRKRLWVTIGNGEAVPVIKTRDKMVRATVRPERVWAMAAPAAADGAALAHHAAAAWADIIAQL